MASDSAAFGAFGAFGAWGDVAFDHLDAFSDTQGSDRFRRFWRIRGQGGVGFDRFGRKNVSKIESKAVPGCSRDVPWHPGAF